MSAPVQGLASALCRLDPQHVAWAHAAARRLAARGFEAAVVTSRGAAGEWYRGEHLAFAPLREPPARGAAAEELVRALAAHEDILGDVEAATGLAAEFADHGRLAQDWPVIALHRGGQAVAQVVVLSEVAPPAPVAAPVVFRAAFVAARLALAEVQRLGAGDLLLLARGSWPLVDDETLPGPGHPPLGLDPETGVVGPVLDRPFEGAPPPMSSSALPEGLTVPVTLHLADMLLTEAELERMTRTGTLELGGVSEGLGVTLAVGGRSIGRGEIVRIGDRFAVLLEGVGAAEPASLPEHGAEDDGQEAA